MATPQEIQKLLEDIQKQYDRLGKENPFANFDTSQFTNANKAIGILNVGLRDARQEVQRLDSDLSGLVSGFDSMIDSIKNSTSGVRNTNKALEGMRGISQKIYYDQQGISKLNNKQLKQIQTQFKQKSKDLELSKSLLQTEIDQLKNLGVLDAKQQKSLDQKEHALNTINEQTVDEASNQKELERRIEARIKLEEQYNKALGLGGAIIGSMKGALDQLGMSGLANKLGFNDALTEMEGLSQEIVNIENDISTLNSNNLSEKQLLAGFGGKHLKTLQEQKNALGGANSNLAVLKKGFSSMGASLIENLKDPLSAGLFVVNQLVKALSSVDKLTGETAKNLGMSYKEANAMVSDMNDIANLSGDIHVNTEGLVKSQLELSKALGTNVMLNKELLVDFTKLTTQAGYSVETMTALGKITQSTGGDLSDNTAEILGTAKAFNATNKLALNEKEIVAEVAKTSAATVLTFGRSADALAKNVMQAKKFGLNLQQAETISSSLLNFQSSIEDEMSAELLTGKSLNFENARMLALQGKTGEAAAEVAKQLGSAEDFGRMNVIQQEALAKAAGMTRDELASSLIEREALAKIGMSDLSSQEAYNKLKAEGNSEEEIAAKLGNDTLHAQMKSESAQGRMVAVTQKLQEVFVSIATPILAIVDPLLNLVTTVLPAVNMLLQPIMIVFKTISSVIGSIVGFLTQSEELMMGLGAGAATYLGLSNKSLILKKAEGAQILFNNTQEKVGNAISAAGQAIQQKGILKSIVDAAMSAYASAAKIPFIGPVLGVAAAAAALTFGYNQLSKADDIMSPGYGKRVLSAPEGTFALNDKDTVVAGTDLDQGSSQPTSSPSINLTPLVEQMNAMNATLNAILNKEGTVMLDSTKVGTALSVGSYKLQ